MKRAKDEAMLEKRCDRFGKFEEHDIDPEEFVKMREKDALLPDGNLLVATSFILFAEAEILVVLL